MQEDNPDDRTAEFVYINPKDALRQMDVCVANLGEVRVGHHTLQLRIIEFPDLDGKKLSLPNYHQPHPLLDDSDVNMAKVLEANAKSVKEREFGEEELKRLDYCLKDLKLPVLLAVHLAINRPEWDLEEFVKLDDDAKPATIVSFVGYAGSGKSTVLAALGHRYGVEVYSLDQFSKKTPADYLNFFNSSELGRNISAGEILKSIGKYRNELKEKEKQPTRTARPLGDVLDEMLKNLKDGHRGLIFMEGTAVRDLGDMRTMNVYDIVSEQATEGYYWMDRSPNVLRESTIDPDMLEDAITYIYGVLNEIEVRALSSRQMFVDALNESTGEKV